MSIGKKTSYAARDCLENILLYGIAQGRFCYKPIGGIDYYCLGSRDFNCPCQEIVEGNGVYCKVQEQITKEYEENKDKKKV